MHDEHHDYASHSAHTKQHDEAHACCAVDSPDKHAGHDMHGGHDKHEGHSPDMFKKKFWLSFLLTIPVVFFSHTIMDILGYTAPVFLGSQWIPPILGTIIFFYGGMVFLQSARHELAAKAPGMMTLISMAITVAFGYSAAVTLGILDGMDFWWEVATLISIMLLGHWLEMASVQNAQGALKELAKLLPDEAELVTGDSTKKVAVSTLKAGDTVLVRPGSNVPADGEVIKGESQVNESMLTGESKPVKKIVSAMVIGGTINGNGSLTVRVSKTGEQSTLAGIMKLVEEAQSSKSKTQILADKAAFYLTFIAIGVALLTLLFWLLFTDRSTAFVIERVVTVLVIACPHALGLAIPLVTAISTTKAARNGLLVRDRLSLESARNIGVVLFDKTGTLTKGEQGVVDVVTVEGSTEQLLALAAGVEADSEHPIAHAIVAAAKQKKLSIPKVDKFAASSGRGVQAVVDGQKMYVGGPRHLEELGLELPKRLATASDKAGNDGKTVVYVANEKLVLGAIMLADVIREESKDAVQSLQRSGKRVAMLTGDSEAVAAWVARELGIDEYFAGVLPEHKADIVKKLQSDGTKVAMVGDGVNDAPALTQADVGIAIGAGTDVAIESAGIVLASSDPRGVAKIVTLSKATYRKMLQNLGWATGYNALAIPLAAGVTYNLGFVLSPALGAVLMSLSTIIVAANAQLLRRQNLA